MAEHETCIGASDDWYTPRDMLDAIGLTFDLDPCSPGPDHWVPARKVYTKDDDGLTQPWHGLVFMNPPFGGRHGHVPWLRKFLEHGNGVAIVRAYTSADWFHAWAVRAETMLFPKGKTAFVRGNEMTTRRKNGTVIVHPAGSFGTSPGHGVVLLGMGDTANRALHRSALGLCIDVTRREMANG